MVPKYVFVSAVSVILSLFILSQLLTNETGYIPRYFHGHVNAVGYPLEVAMLIFATGKYITFAETFIVSLRKYFDCPLCNVTYVIFSDNSLSKPAEDILLIPYKLIGWPYDTLKRVHAFQKSKDQLDRFDYLLAIDADMRARSRVGMEMLGDRVATLHPAFYHNKVRGTYENNTHSSAYVSPSEGGLYFAGGFYGGRRDEFWQLAEGMINLIDADLAHSYIAVWHDESYLNRYFATNPPTNILSPAYCSPEHWSLPYEKKIVAKAKRHSVARS